MTVPYLGAAPEEVETGVCARIEERLTGITGIKEVRSLSAEGRCTVHVEMFLDADRSQTLGEVENQVNAIDTFPEETERPIIALAENNNVVVEVAITGPTDERTLKELGHRVRDDLLALPAVTHAALINVRPYEISVEVSEASLSRNNLTFDDVARAVRERSLDLPGGSIKTEQGEIVLRTAGQAYWGHELENLVVTTRADGTRVFVRDVARVVDGFEDTGQALRFDGRPAALVQVSRVGDQDVREVAEAVRGYVSRAAGRHPEGVELTTWRDESVVLAFRLRALLDSGIQGLLLVLILLALFLRPNLAIWVAGGIPIAFLGAIFLLYWFGLSINSLSVMGFILALGMLVDDAVVVGEAAYVEQRRGAGQLAGAIAGAQQVLIPVTFGVITTAVAFLPLLFGTSTLGQAYGVMAATVICCLVFSLIECQAVLPSHLGHGSGRLPLGDFGLTLLAVVVVASPRRHARRALGRRAGGRRRRRGAGRTLFGNAEPARLRLRPRAGPVRVGPDVGHRAPVSPARRPRLPQESRDVAHRGGRVGIHRQPHDGRTPAVLAAHAPDRGQRHRAADDAHGHQRDRHGGGRGHAGRLRARAPARTRP